MGTTLAVTSDVFLGLAFVAVGIRLWSRKIQRHGLFLNDYAVVLAWIFAASLVITSNIAIIQFGSGKHLELVNPADIPEILKTALAADVLWGTANTLFRISIVNFYMTIFRSNKVFLRVAYAVMAFVIAFGIAIAISDFLTCRPLAKYWDPLLSGVCEDPIASSVALSSCNVATDLIIVLLPMPMVWGLQMPIQRKVELTIVFALGFLVCVVTIIHLVLSAQLNLDDFTYNIAKIGIPTLLEPLLGIIAACLPLFPPAFRKVMGEMKTGNSEQRNFLSSSIARLRLKRSRFSTFESLGDSFPLTDLENNKSEISISGPSGKHDSWIADRTQLAEAVIPSPASI